MNAAHAHLLVTHWPVMGTVFGLVLLAAGIVRWNGEVQRCGLLLFVIAAVGVIPAYLTGEPALELAIKSMPSTASDSSDSHADLAILAFGATALLGGASLTGLICFTRKGAPSWFIALVLVLALLTTAVLSWTAHLGGRMAHPEIQQLR